MAERNDCMIRVDGPFEVSTQDEGGNRRERGGEARMASFLLIDFQFLEMQKERIQFLSVVAKRNVKPKHEEKEFEYF